MRLPERLDYFEDQIAVPEDQGYPEWHPVVTCTVAGCDWQRGSDWDDLADDSDVDWDIEHPAHDAEVLAHR